MLRRSEKTENGIIIMRAIPFPCNIGVYIIAVVLMLIANNCIETKESEACPLPNLELAINFECLHIWHFWSG